MRIRTAQIAGYGRFCGETIDFVPGLQVIAGPDEEGKSTIRSFLADMLYGRKPNDLRSIYDESSTLRAPQNGCSPCGGSLIYELDDGRIMEIVRNFDPDNESIQVLDRLSGQDLTETFTRFRNRELDFARRHLGLTREHFLNTATIAPMCLDNVGDREAVDQIREALLSLADSGGGAGTVESALQYLDNRIAAIGRPDARSMPLPMARQQRVDLEREYAHAREQQESLGALAITRKTVLDAAEMLLREKRAAEAALDAHSHHDDLALLSEVEALQEQINAMALQCETLKGARHFPLELDSEVQTAARSAADAARQLAGTRVQYEALKLKLDAEQREGTSPSGQSNEFPAALEYQINEAQATLNQLEQRIDEARSLVIAAKDRMEEVQRQLAALPDFSRLSADPVEWLTQLASSFAVALRAREEECALRAVLRKEVAILQEKNAPYDPLFAPCADFSELAREYEVQARLLDSQRKQHASDLHSLQSTYEEVQGELRAFLPMGMASLLIACVIGGYYFFSDNREVGFGALVTLVVGLIFLTMHLSQKGHMKRLTRNINLAEEELSRIAEEHKDRVPEKIDNMLRDADLENVRELEALYDQYKSTQMELRIRRTALDAQEEKAAEAEARVPQLLARFQDTFAKAGETIEGESDVQEASGRAIARYQVYREAKRRATSNRAVLERHEAELKRLELLAAQTARDLEAGEREAREFVLDYGLPDAEGYASVKDLIRAFRERIANSRERQGRHDLLSENLRKLERQIETEQADLDRAGLALASLFVRQGVATIEQWNAQAVSAREYLTLNQQLTGLKKHLENKLGRHSLASLQQRVARFGKSDALPEESQDSLRETIARLDEAIAQKAEEEHALYVEMTQQSGRMRSVSELEEERALVTANIQALEAEVEAASYAMALLEATAHDKRAEIAPGLAELASRYLAALTNGACTGLSLGRDLSLELRASETEGANETTENSLDGRMVGPIYLALRLAFAECVSQSGERIPVLLDDPFADYDNERLESAMRLMTELAERKQIVLFTCREDVVSVAEKLNASLIRL